MVKRKEEEKICFVCSEIVNKKKDHHVLLGTYNRAIGNDEELYFHFQCFTDWFMEKVSNRAKGMVSQMRDQAIKVMESPMIRGMLSQIKGSDQLVSMLNTPLQIKETRVVKIKEKIDDGRKKRRKRKK